MTAKPFTWHKSEYDAWLRYHLGLARLAVSVYPHKGDRLLQLDPLARKLHDEMSRRGHSRYVPYVYDDADRVMNNGYERGIYRPTVNAWKRLRHLLVEKPENFVKYDVASKETIDALRKSLKLV